MKGLTAVSLLLNRLTGGPKDFTLCARFHAGRRVSRPVHTFLANLIDVVLWFDPQHCASSWHKRAPKRALRKEP